MKLTKKVIAEVMELIKAHKHKEQIMQYISLYNHYTQRGNMNHDYNKSRDLIIQILTFSGWAQIHSYEYNNMIS